jgi:diphosphomevalonate decarboxylase
MSEHVLVTGECAPNIALIKYWGKSNEDLILPLNSSISITLDRNVLNSKTTVCLTKRDANNNNNNNKNSPKITLLLNGQKQEFDENDTNNNAKSDLINRKRFFKILKKIRDNCELNEPYSHELRICSMNNFPTACGMASSASGFACLALCLSYAYKYRGDASELARLGSGSACRSCTGGFVKWHAGSNSNESIAQSLFPSDYWPELNVIALILEDQRKSVSSTNGMRDSVLTSELLKSRVELVEYGRIQKMENAIRNKDFDHFAELTMKESNSFHAVCMDTYPPLFYLNDKSKDIIRFVNEFNSFDSSEKRPGLKCAYSFDAGPNAFLFVQDKNLKELLYLIYKVYFKSNNISEEEFHLSDNFMLNQKFKAKCDFRTLDLETRINLDLFYELFRVKTHRNNQNDDPKVVKYLLHSSVGGEPSLHINGHNQSLLDLNRLSLD